MFQKSLGTLLVVLVSFGASTSLAQIKCSHLAEIIKYVSEKHVDTPKILGFGTPEARAEGRKYQARIIRSFGDVVDPLKVFLLARERAELDAAAERSSAVFYDIANNRTPVFDRMTVAVNNARNRIGEFLVADGHKTYYAVMDYVARLKKGEKFDFEKPPATTEEQNQRFLVLFANHTIMHEARGLPVRTAYAMALRTMRDLLKETFDPKETPELVAKSIFKSVDPHSEFWSAKEWEQFKKRMSGDVVGVGIALEPVPRGYQVKSVVEGSGADGKLKEGDIITHVTDVPYRGLSRGQKRARRTNTVTIEEMVEWLSGELGTHVYLRVRRKSRLIDVVIRRTIIPTGEMRVTTDVKTSKNGNIGILKFDAFYNGVSKDIEKELRGLIHRHDIKSLVIDLRNNGGGAIAEAVAIAGMFMRSGVVGILDGPNGRQVFADQDGVQLFNQPITILVNRNSASASELLTDTLRARNMVVVVGSPSFGKGTAQKPDPMVEHSRIIGIRGQRAFTILGVLKVTGEQYFTADGTSPQNIGVDLDIPFKELNGKKMGEADLPYAIPEGRAIENHVRPHEYRFPGMEKLVARLKELSDARVRQNRDWDQAILEDDAQALWDLHMTEAQKVAEDFMRLAPEPQS